MWKNIFSTNNFNQFVPIFSRFQGISFGVKGIVWVTSMTDSSENDNYLLLVRPCIREILPICLDFAVFRVLLERHSVSGGDGVHKEFKDFLHLILKFIVQKLRVLQEIFVTLTNVFCRGYRRCPREVSRSSPPRSILVIETILQKSAVGYGPSTECLPIEKNLGRDVDTAISTAVRGVLTYIVWI